MRIALLLFILATCGWILGQKLNAEQLATLPDRLAGIAVWQWACAAALTAMSLYSVGRYDGLAHRFLRTRIPNRAAQATGSVAITLGQTLGFGLFTGAVARWRMLPALGAATAFRLSVFVSVTFILSWVVLTSVACLILPAPGWSTWPAALGLVSAYVVALALFFCPQLLLGSWRAPLPSWRLSGGILFWALVDTVTAAAAMFVMLPADSISFAAFYPVFMVATGAALMSNTPGGLGPFEVVLLSALPAVSVEAALTAILAHCIVYYVIPACLAGLALLRPFSNARPRAEQAIHSTIRAPRSEVSVVRQNGGTIRNVGRTALALWPTGQTLSLLADPLSGGPAQAVSALRAMARDAALIPMMYKAGPELATAARRAGWSVLHIADDAIVPLAEFDLLVPKRRTLRRKLRAAQKAGIEIETDRPLPHRDLSRIDAAWQRTHGRARGGSMGRYCPHYLVDQWVAVAKLDGQCVAFVTAHRAQGEWCLDIMRHDDTVPEGTMHALVHAAICAAKSAGARTFCLAATPACPDPSSAFWRWAAMQVVRRAGGPGLRQFKSSFGPVWRPRYAASTNPAALAVGLLDIMRAIRFPQPLAPQSSNAPHDLDENYELASHRAA